MKKAARTGKRLRNQSHSNTGAPPPYFLLTIGDQDRVAPSLAQWKKKEREPLATMSSEEITDRIWASLIELVDRIVCPKYRAKGWDSPEPSVQLEAALMGLEDSHKAAEDLATVAVSAANLLHELAHSKCFKVALDISLVARRRPTWPVNMNFITKNGKRCLKGVEKVRTYLDKIQLGQNAPFIPLHSMERDSSPFKRAAESLLYHLYHQRKDPSLLFTPWQKRLRSLEIPMTKKNAKDWWSVAKAWMDEQWEIHHELFAPLIKRLELDDKNFTPSMVKRRVIDDSLKKAFKALACAVVEN